MSDDIRKKRRKQPKKKSELDEAANTTEKASDNKTSEAEKASSTLVNSDQDTDFKSNWWWIKTVLFLCIVGLCSAGVIFFKELSFTTVGADCFIPNYQHTHLDMSSVQQLFSESWIIFSETMFASPEDKDVEINVMNEKL